MDAGKEGDVWLTGWPLWQDADSTDIYQISRVWKDLVKRARSKQLVPDEYNSGNFTISNLGMFGADTFDAILPPGEGQFLSHQSISEKDGAAKEWAVARR